MELTAPIDQFPQDNSGYVYILFNPIFRENQYKIGMTARTPDERAREISSATGVPSPFEVIFEAPVADRLRAERLMHQRLAQYRLNRSREFFELPLKEAVATLNEIAKEVGQPPKGEPTQPPNSLEASSFHEFDVRLRQRTPRGRKSKEAQQPTGPVTFDDHVSYTDTLRQPILHGLRQHVLSLNPMLAEGEIVTRAQRIAYRIPGKTIFLEIKVQRSAVLLRLIETVAPMDRLDVREIPKTHGWRDLKQEIRLTSEAEMPAAFKAIETAFTIASRDSV